MKKVLALTFLIFSISIAVNAQEEILTKAEAIKVEAQLKKNPTDFMMRTRLIWFYELKKSATDKMALQRLRLDCVRFTPDHGFSAFACSGTWTPEDVKRPEYLSLKNEWLKQIGLRKTEKRVLLNAQYFFSEAEPEIAEKILNDGKNLEPFDPEFTYTQIANDKINYSFHSNMIGIEEDATLNPKIHAVLKRIVVWAKDGINRIDKKEEKTADDLEFRNDFIADGASAAFDLEDFIVAGELAELLLNSLDIYDGGIYEFRKVRYFQIGMSIKGRVALRNGNVDKAREYLMNSLKLLPEDHREQVRLDSKFLSEILIVEGRRPVLDYLSEFEKYLEDTDELKAEITNFKIALAKGKNPGLDMTLISLY